MFPVNNVLIIYGETMLVLKRPFPAKKMSFKNQQVLGDMDL